ncbi:MAG TPA: PHP domain-containing protein, partial [Candidatus Paceibacterota bacterium]|nr:PHP domain-containing protein [Candidatus Paceibacterota bacterium]
MFSQLHLHCHIGSRLDAIGSPEDYAQRASDFNHPYLALTDHGRISGIYEHQIQCLKFGVKPIIGVEIYVVGELEVFNKVKKRERTKTNHLILLVKNKKGYSSLLKLNYASMKDTSHFYYSPRIIMKELIENKEGLIIGTGCMANPISRLLLAEKENKAEELYIKMLDTFKDDFYTEIQLNELEEQKIINEFMIRLANKHGVPLVMTGDVHYLEKGQDKLQTLAIAIRDKTTIDNIQFELESKNLYYHDIPDYIEFNKKFNFNYKEEDILSWC